MRITPESAFGLSPSKPDRPTKRVVWEDNHIVIMECDPTLQTMAISSLSVFTTRGALREEEASGPVRTANFGPRFAIQHDNFRRLWSVGNDCIRNPPRPGLFDDAVVAEKEKKNKTALRYKDEYNSDNNSACSTKKSMAETDVLIVGAGPTGLVLALWLSKLGIKVRLIDKAAQAATSTRAIVVQARTLELYDQLDPTLADELCENAHPIGALNIWVRGTRAFRLPIIDVGKRLTPRAPTQTISQHQHEKLLADRLLRYYGVPIELQKELLDFSQETPDKEAGGDTEVTEPRPGPVTALIQTSQGTETIHAKYIAGCDGSHSTVRKKLDIPFPGGTYDRLFYVADIRGGGPVMDGQVHICLDKSDFLAVFPLAGQGHGRLLGTIEDTNTDQNTPHKSLTFDDVGDEALQRMGLQVNKVTWFSSYRLHHRVAENFRHNRAFLLGDAAHVHSPVGGQGMNTGIGDAVNLAWKMASVLRGTASEALLDTYQEERRHFAESLVASTDRIFTMVTSKGWLARVIRTRIMPLVFRVVFSYRAVKSFFFATGSQLMLHYRDMSLSSCSSGGTSRVVRAGERLPWVKTADGVDNFTSLNLEWQVHVYGRAHETLLAWCKEHEMPVMVYDFGEGCSAAGLVRDALYLVRPDGHVALVERGGRPEVVERYFAERQMRL
ncbi:hypothetical protein E4U45_006696 [Claviceps purpurea]|nr:hypothetical protein E4U45_006696 [Claviceps purpurea]